VEARVWWEVRRNWRLVQWAALAQKSAVLHKNKAERHKSESLLPRLLDN
jgi:ribosomal protein S20